MKYWHSYSLMPLSQALQPSKTQRVVSLGNNQKIIVGTQQQSYLGGLSILIFRFGALLSQHIFLP